MIAAVNIKYRIAILNTIIACIIIGSHNAAFAEFALGAAVGFGVGIWGTALGMLHISVSAEAHAEAQKVAEIEELEEEISGLEDEISEFEDEISGLDEEKQDLQSQIDDLNSQISEQRSEIQTRRDDIAAKRSRIAELQTPTPPTTPAPPTPPTTP